MTAQAPAPSAKDGRLVRKRAVIEGYHAELYAERLKRRFLALRLGGPCSAAIFAIKLGSSTPRAKRGVLGDTATKPGIDCNSSTHRR